MTPVEAVRRLQSRPKSLSGLLSCLQFVTNAAGRRRKKPAIAPDDFLYQLKRVSLPNERVITGYLTFSSNGDDQHQHLYESHWESALKELEELGAALKVVGPAVGLFTEGLESLPDVDFFVFQLHHAQDENARLLMGTNLNLSGEHDKTSFIADLELDSHGYLSRIGDILEGKVATPWVAENTRKKAAKTLSSKVPMAINGAPVLKENHLAILEALHALKAKNARSRRTREQIAKHIDKDNNLETIAKPIAYLSKCDYVDTLRGRTPNGMPRGCFITSEGLKRLKEETTVRRRKGG
jgi:hypothetical protein